MKYRKKPIVIEAIQWTGTIESQRELQLTFGPKINISVIPADLEIQTPEGTMVACPGDWIIRGIIGELYPCKKDVFEATYEVVE